MFCNKCGNAIDIKKMCCKRCKYKVVLEEFSDIDLNTAPPKTYGGGAIKTQQKKNDTPKYLYITAVLAVAVVAICAYFMLGRWNKPDKKAEAEKTSPNTVTESVKADKNTEKSLWGDIKALSGTDSEDKYICMTQMLRNINMDSEIKEVYKIILNGEKITEKLSEMKDNTVANAALLMCGGDEAVFNAEEMTRLWRMSLHEMSGEVNADKCKAALLSAAKKLNMSDEEFEKIEASFEKNDKDKPEENNQKPEEDNKENNGLGSGNIFSGARKVFSAVKKAF